MYACVCATFTVSDLRYSPTSAIHIEANTPNKHTHVKHSNMNRNSEPYYARGIARVIDVPYGCSAENLGILRPVLFPDEHHHAEGDRQEQDRSGAGVDMWEQGRNAHDGVHEDDDHDAAVRRARDMTHVMDKMLNFEQRLAVERMVEDASDRTCMHRAQVCVPVVAA